MDIKEIIKSAVADYKINLSDSQLKMLEQYFDLLVEWNEKINLTAITDEQGVAVKHFADSLSLFNFVYIPQGSSVIDVGTGAGFPGIVLKIARPDIKLTLLDSLKKRLNFLDEVLSALSLDAALIHSRAEDGGQNIDLRECFDFTVSRAVARLNVLSEYCLPYTRIGGRFIALKGPDAQNEIEDAKRAIQIFGGKIVDIHSFSLPYDGGNRNIIETEKILPTPDKYPRPYGKIKAKPL